MQYRSAFHRLPAGALALGAAFTILLTAPRAQETSVRLSVLADARSGTQTAWQYTTSDPGSDTWNGKDFDATSWSTGMGGFGSGTIENSHINSEWSTPQIWIRKTFTLASEEIESLVLSLHHDDDADIYLNGQQVYQETGWLSNYSEFYLAKEYNSLLQPGENVLAITCRNTGGPGYIDAGLWLDTRVTAATLVSDARTFPTEWSYVTADPGMDWQKPEFDAGGWLKGPSGFGTGDIYASRTSTPWEETDIWMRADFKVDSPYLMYQLHLMHDDDAEVYVNGNLVLNESGFSADGYSEQVLDAVAQAMKLGDNTLAVHCHNNSGPGFVDAGLLGLAKPVTTALGRSRSRAHSQTLGTAVLTGGPEGVNVSSLTAKGAGRLTVYALDGHAVAALEGGKGAGYLRLPVTLATGMFRYHWDSPTGSLQGAFIHLRNLR